MNSFSHFFNQWTTVHVNLLKDNVNYPPKCTDGNETNFNQVLRTFAVVGGTTSLLSPTEFVENLRQLKRLDLVEGEL
ncbi:hypothetical protein PROFUN_01067 [Planoprotostelium fungivorum]|uniref:Uncharacterized protein n=1 Tax=Planoprotostelium fungivorum TaxID=1890364 RepID=A0A2P6NC86_9EUKA|nr:hypothetical protein PROFUN_01067 [Planoprotostelium fungivorum]